MKNQNIFHFLNCMDEALEHLLLPLHGESLERLQLISIKIKDLNYGPNFLSSSCHNIVLKKDKKIQSYILAFELKQQENSYAKGEIEYFLRGKRKFTLPKPTKANKKFSADFTFTKQDISDFFESLGKPNDFFTDENLLILVGKTDILVPNQMLIAKILEISLNKSDLFITFFTSAKAGEKILISLHDGHIYFETESGEPILQCS